MHQGVATPRSSNNGDGDVDLDDAGLLISAMGEECSW